MRHRARDSGPIDEVMKKALLFTVALLAVAATPFRIRAILENAVANERTAAARYEAFAAKAIEEGHLGAASLFRAAARAEHVHTNRFEAAMRARGLNVPEARTNNPVVGATIDNIRAAAAAEAAERDGIYREATEVASEYGDAELMKMFDQARDTEVEHANILATLLRNQNLLTTAKTYYVCDSCGYTSDVALPLCALCRSRNAPAPVE